jgi:hypothetical protein
VSKPVPKKIRHSFVYGTEHHFYVEGTDLNGVQQVTVTDSDATWVVNTRSMQVSPTSVEFDATPSKRSGLGGTGSLTITVSNVPVSPTPTPTTPPPSQTGSVTAGDGSYYSGS